MTVQQNVPGDAVVRTVSLFTDRGTVNMTEHVYQINIYESIFTPGVVVALTVFDTKSLASLMPILGGERLLLEVMTPGRRPVKYDLVITAFTDAVPAENMRTKAYSIRAVTPETVIDKTVQVSKAYNTNISSMVEDITRSYLRTTKQVNVQQTRGIQQIIIPSLNPFKAITMLRHNAISIQNRSSSYVFFENQNGFHFKTLENLMAQNDPGDRVFTNDETLRTNIRASGFRNLIGYTQPQQFEVIQRLSSGGLAHEVKSFDYKTLTYRSQVSTFNPTTYRNADGQLRSPDSNDLLQRYGRTAGSNMMVHKDSGLPDTFLSDGLGARSNATSLYSQGNLLLKIFGDSEITAGQIIELRLSENMTISQAPPEHSQLSGKYLIATLHHEIKSEGNNPRYTCAIEALKGGYRGTV